VGHELDANNNGQAAAKSAATCVGHAHTSSVAYCVSQAHASYLA